MTRIAVRRGWLVVALLACAACVERRPMSKLSAKVFTFTTKFDSSGCPTESLPDVANCDNKKPDCVYVSKGSRDRVKFRPAGNSSDPRYAIRFDPAARLATLPDASVSDDGKHWDLLIATDAPEKKEQKFTVTSETCPTKPLDPIVIVGP